MSKNNDVGINADVITALKTMVDDIVSGSVVPTAIKRQVDLTTTGSVCYGYLTISFAMPKKKVKNVRV